MIFRHFTWTAKPLTEQVNNVTPNQDPFLPLRKILLYKKLVSLAEQITFLKKLKVNQTEAATGGVL